MPKSRLVLLYRLRNAGLKLVFVTNTTKESKKSLHKRLIKLGFNIEQEEIFTSLTAARNLLLERKLRPKLYLQDNAKEQFKGLHIYDYNYYPFVTYCNPFNKTI